MNRVATPTKSGPVGTGHPDTELPEGEQQALWQAATGVLNDNWSGDHTMPSHALYPHQWSWDSAFISIGLARYSPGRAWRELRSLFEAQWADGRVPHIVFDPGVA